MVQLYLEHGNAGRSCVMFGIVFHGAFQQFLVGPTCITMDPRTVGKKWDYNSIFPFRHWKYGVIADSQFPGGQHGPLARPGHGSSDHRWSRSVACADREDVTVLQ